VEGELETEGTAERGKEDEVGDICREKEGERRRGRGWKGEGRFEPTEVVKG